MFHHQSSMHTAEIVQLHRCNCTHTRGYAGVLKAYCMTKMGITSSSNVFLQMTYHTGPSQLTMLVKLAPYWPFSQHRGSGAQDFIEDMPTSITGYTGTNTLFPRPYNNFQSFFFFSQSHLKEKRLSLFFFNRFHELNRCKHSPWYPLNIFPYSAHPRICCRVQ